MSGPFNPKRKDQPVNPVVPPENMGVCRVCELVDGDTTLKHGFFCKSCKAFICDACKPNWGRRALAATKSLVKPK